jgi:hypothetical protein
MIVLTRFDLWFGLTFTQLQHIELSTINIQTIVCVRL